MGNPYLSEIRLMSIDFAPVGWLPCDGRLLPMNQYQPLFSLLGTTYGGDGRTTFGLPDLRGRAPIHFGAGYPLGTRGGETSHTVTVSEMPAHSHAFNARDAATETNAPGGNMLGSVANLYGPVGAMTVLEPATVTNAGGSQPHQNMQPYLALTFCIAIAGIFPSPN